MLDEYTVKVSNHFTCFSPRNGELSVKYYSIPKFPVFDFSFSYIISKTNDRIKKKSLSKNVDLDELYTEIFPIFQFDTLFIDLSLFAFGQYFCWFSRVSAFLWSGSSIVISVSIFRWWLGSLARSWIGIDGSLSDRGSDIVANTRAQSSSRSE